MKTAEEYREITKKNKDSKQKEILDYLEVMFSQTAAKGLNKVLIDGQYINDSILKILKDKGFKVTSGGRPNECDYLISWGTDPENKPRFLEICF